MESILNRNILIIDDDKGILRALGRVLTHEGAIVTGVEWAGDVMKILSQRHTAVDLVITDLRMPFVTGMTVLYAIHEAYPDLPVIVLTAFGTPDLKAECLRQGAAAFLEKPLDTPHLLAAVRGVLASRKVAP